MAVAWLGLADEPSPAAVKFISNMNFTILRSMLHQVLTDWTWQKIRYQNTR
jgi:hypothetical protein